MCQYWVYIFAIIEHDSWSINWFCFIWNIPYSRWNVCFFPFFNRRGISTNFFFNENVCDRNKQKKTIIGFNYISILIKLNCHGGQLMENDGKMAYPKNVCENNLFCFLNFNLKNWIRNFRHLFTMLNDVFFFVRFSYLTT